MYECMRLYSYSTFVYELYNSVNNTTKISVLARIDKFSNLPVINFFLQLSKQKTSYLCGVFGATKCERKHANQQFNTYLLICKQTRKIYEHSHRPMCQYIAPCVITGLNVIGYSQMLIKNNYYMLFIFCSKPLEVHE